MVFRLKLSTRLKLRMRLRTVKEAKLKTKVEKPNQRRFVLVIHMLCMTQNNPNKVVLPPLSEFSQIAYVGEDNEDNRPVLTTNCSYSHFNSFGNTLFTLHFSCCYLCQIGPQIFIICRRKSYFRRTPW